MSRKTYGVETILHKRRNRPFPKEVVKEVEKGEDLFSALCATKIKEIKHKAKNEEKKKKKKKKTREMPSFEVLWECPSRENLMDSFDALMIAPREKTENSHSHCSELHLFERFTNIPLRKNNIRIEEEDVYKENLKDSCENLQDNRASLAHDVNKGNKILSTSKRESTIFSINGRKHGNLSCETRETCIPNLNDSDLALLDCSQELESLTNDFINGKINIQGLKNEEPWSKSRKAKVQLLRNSNKVLNDYMSSEEEEKEKTKKEEDNLDVDKNSSNEIFRSPVFFNGRRKNTCKLVNSTPASCNHLEPDCILSPILPLLPQCSVDEEYKRVKHNVALEPKSLFSVPRIKDFDSEQNEKQILIRESLDPFSGSGDKRILNNFERYVLPSRTMEEHSVKPVSSNTLHNYCEKFCSSSSIDVEPKEKGCSHAFKEISVTRENSVHNIDYQSHLNTMELDQNGSVIVSPDKSLEGCEEKSDKSEAKVSCTLRFSRTPRQDLAPNLEGSSLLEPRFEKLALSFSRRSSHIVLPLAQHDVFKKTSGFREVYTTSCVINHTNLDYNTIKESCLDGMKNEEITFKDVVLELCEQTEILHFLEIFSDCDFTECKKIGEGVYGEVFSRTNPDGISSVMKIIPIEGIYEINGEKQKKYEEILPEIVITRELSNLRTNENFGTLNFPELIRCWCVQGTYPSKLLKLWQEFDEEKGSENDSPETHAENQIYIILEMSNVGSAMEGFTFSSTSQALSAFLQVANALAAAEAALEFEHRDLHWGNILIKRTKERFLPWKLYGEERNLRTFGIQATVIDFTLSRITYDGCCIYNNLADDPALFEGQDDYQFDIYRLMRNQTGNNWDVFKPYNNVLWLSYVLEKLISGVKYHKNPGKAHKKGMIKLQQLHKEITNFESAMDVALSFVKK